MDESFFADRLAAARERLAEAARDSGRAMDEVTIVAVSKHHPAESIRALAAAGQQDFGENYIQEFYDKNDSLHIDAIRWHFTGRLQSNKVKYAVGRFHLIHTVDSLKLARTLHNRAQQQETRQRVLVQVNVDGEEQKGGLALSELHGALDSIVALDGLDLRGLMCMPRYYDDPEDARPSFARLRELGEQSGRRLGFALEHYSMGMSHDYVQAVKEGATLVRIGTNLFGPRPSNR